MPRLETLILYAHAPWIFPQADGPEGEPLLLDATFIEEFLQAVKLRSEARDPPTSILRHLCMNGDYDASTSGLDGLTSHLEIFPPRSLRPPRVSSPVEDDF